MWISKDGSFPMIIHTNQYRDVAASTNVNVSCERTTLLNFQLDIISSHLINFGTYILKSIHVLKVKGNVEQRKETIHELKLKNDEFNIFNVLQGYAYQ